MSERTGGFSNESSTS